MSTFINAVERQTMFTKTENGASALSTTDSALVDLFSTIGALRNASDQEIVSKFDRAFNENPLLALKTLFYARNIRGGLGERRTPNIILKHLGNTYSDIINKNIHIIPNFGRWDDLYSFVGTKSEDKMWELMLEQFVMDYTIVSNPYKVQFKPISLLGKWLKSPDTSSHISRRLARKTARKFGLTTKGYTRALRELRAYLNVVETKMSSKDWSSVDYSTVPSNAMSNYTRAFHRNDSDRYIDYINALAEGKAKVNASTLYPYNIMEKMGLNDIYDANFTFDNPDDVLISQWNSLPNYVTGDNNIIVMADTSGSMAGRPMATSIGLAMYFAERNSGYYKDIFMTFSSTPSFVKLKGNTLQEKVSCIPAIIDNTDLQAAFKLILDTAIHNNVPQEDLPKALVVISDMQIDYCGNVGPGYSTFYETMQHKFSNAGYNIPEVIFWNVNTPRDTFHADSNIPGVRMYSGQSVSTFKAVLGSIGKTAYEAMMDVLSDPIYDCVIV